MIRKILQIGNPILTTTSALVPKKDIVSKEIKQLIVDLKDTLNSDPDSSAGLSAVQLGDLLQVFIMRRLDLESEGGKIIWEAVINPKMTVLDNTPQQEWEGCLSIGTGGKRLFGPIFRPKKVKLEYTAEDGTGKTLIASDYMSHIIQHEMDHLSGVLFLKYVPDLTKLWSSKELDKYIEKYGEFPDPD